MRRDQCPACGASGYRGRRCSRCLYEPFTEEVLHRTHYHAGEPLVLDTRPRPVRPGQGCASYSGRRTRPFPARSLLLILAALLAIFVPGGFILALIIVIPLLKKKK